MNSKSLTVTILREGDSLDPYSLKSVNRNSQANERSHENSTISLNRKGSPFAPASRFLGKILPL